MVGGWALACTQVPRVSQWALTIKMAWGLARCCPICVSVRVKVLSCMAFMGLPWAINSAGMRLLACRDMPLAHRGKESAMAKDFWRKERRFIH
jgi:hypothetical protein